MPKEQSLSCLHPPVPVFLSPAMNTRMFENPIVQNNIQILKEYGYRLIEPKAGYLACGDTGQGKMPEPEVLLEYILQELAFEKDLQGKKILITAGTTSLKPWPFVKAVQTTSAREMFEAVTAVSDSQDIIIKAAAVADYRPARVSSHKMKKKEDAAGIIPDKLLSL